MSVRDGRNEAGSDFLGCNQQDTVLANLTGMRYNILKAIIQEAGIAFFDNHD